MKTIIIFIAFFAGLIAMDKTVNAQMDNQRQACFDYPAECGF